MFPLHESQDVDPDICHGRSCLIQFAKERLIASNSIEQWYATLFRILVQCNNIIKMILLIANM